jgi:hypothetical protein
MATDQNITPTISRVLENGTLIELVYDPDVRSTALAICDDSGRLRTTDLFELSSGERLVPYSASNNLIANECVLLPSDIGDFRDKGDVLEQVRSFIHRYIDLSPTFEAAAAHYVLLTWVYDAFSDLAYLRFRGDFGTGKTRALLTIGSLCYKPFFASGASTVSPIFHIQDAFQGTLILDEADRRRRRVVRALSRGRHRQGRLRPQASPDFRTTRSDRRGASSPRSRTRRPQDRHALQRRSAGRGQRPIGPLGRSSVGTAAADRRDDLRPHRYRKGGRGDFAPPSPFRK